MRKKSTPPRLTKLGGPEAGSVAALALGQDKHTTLFVGTQVGVYRSVGFDGAALQRWERLTTAPIGVLTLAASPNFATDRTLLAGTNTGLYISRDAGATWVAAQLPLTGSVIIALAFSPNYANDGLIMAGSLEDGILFSQSYGEKWGGRSFGVVDATILSVAFSPNFAHDQTAYIGTDTALYHSYNGTLAWKPRPFPDDAPPVLGLGLSPNFENDQTLFAGTETQGLYRSADAGETWQKLAFPANCVNAVLCTANQLIAATEAGIYTSADQGETWTQLFDLENVMCLLSTGNALLAGLVDQGLWLTADMSEWQALPNLSTRTLLGLTLSPHFTQDSLAFMFGPREGIWATEDGGQTWNALNDTLPSLDIAALVVSPNFADDGVLVAASPNGVLLSDDVGAHWKTIAPAAATGLAFAPTGGRLAAYFPGGGIGLTDNLGQTWTRLPGAWDMGGKVLALTLTETNTLIVALLEGVGETLSIWQGSLAASGSPQFEKVLRHDAGTNPVVSFFVPSEPAPDRPWYASLGNRVWKFSSRKGRAPSPVAVFEDAEAETILSLTGVGPMLLAHTGQHVYKSTDAKAWTKVHDFGSEPAVALTLSPDYATDKKVYVLILGGYFCEATIW